MKYGPGSSMQTSKGKKRVTRSPAGAALTELMLQLFKTNAALQSTAPEVTQDPRITSPRWQILGAIRHEGKTAAQLGRELGLSRQITLWNAQFLADEGLVTFENNPNHQRAHLVTLAPEGRVTLDQLTENQIAWVNSLARDFDVPQLENALQTLAQLCERLR